MPEFNWNEILITEDRIIANSNRKHRAHFVSWDVITENYIYHLSSNQYQHDIILNNDNYINRVDNPTLAKALKALTPKQSQVIELLYWEGYKGYEIAKIMNCSAANISILQKKALSRIKHFFENN